MEYKGEEIVYIEYQNGKPFSVETGIFGKWSLETYDFEPDGYNEDSFMHYNSGSGGSVDEIQAPTYVEGSEDTCCFWLHPRAKLKGEPKNIKQIAEPLVVNGSANPFDNSREVYDIIFCKHCDKYLDEDWCEHLYTDEAGYIHYTDGELHDG